MENVHFTIQHTDPDQMKPKFDDDKNSDERLAKLSELFNRAQKLPRSL